MYTPMDKEVFKLYKEGKTIMQISKILCISEYSVRTRLARNLRKHKEVKAGVKNVRL